MFFKIASKPPNEHSAVYQRAGLSSFYGTEDYKEIIALILRAAHFITAVWLRHFITFRTSNFGRGIFDSDDNCRQRMNQFGHYYSVYLSNRERIICRRQLYHYLYIFQFVWLELKRVDMHMCDG